MKMEWKGKQSLQTRSSISNILVGGEKSTGMKIGLRSSEDRLQFFLNPKKRKTKPRGVRLRGHLPKELSSSSWMNNHLKRMLGVIRMPARDGETGQMSWESRGRWWRDQLSKTRLRNLGRGTDRSSPEFFGCRTKGATRKGEWWSFAIRKG